MPWRPKKHRKSNQNFFLWQKHRCTHLTRIEDSPFEVFFASAAPIFIRIDFRFACFRLTTARAKQILTQDIITDIHSYKVNDNPIIPWRWRERKINTTQSRHTIHLPAFKHSSTLPSTLGIIFLYGLVTYFNNVTEISAEVIMSKLDFSSIEWKWS